MHRNLSQVYSPNRIRESNQNVANWKRLLLTGLATIAIPLGCTYVAVRNDPIARTHRNYASQIEGWERRIVEQGDTCWDLASTLPGDTRYWIDQINAESRRRVQNGEDVTNCNSLMQGDTIYLPVISQDAKKPRK